MTRHPSSLSWVGWAAFGFPAPATPLHGRQLLVTNITDVKRWNRTHEALRQAAVKLFTERGYDATTTTEIAAHAGVSEMTLFRHFRTKESLLSADPFDPLMAEAVRGRPPGEPPMQALTEGIRRALAQLHEEDVEDLRMLLRIIASTPVTAGSDRTRQRRDRDRFGGGVA